MADPQLILLPPGERLTPPLLPDGKRYALTTHPTSHARMTVRAGVLYVAMKHGHSWPRDLTALDHDRLDAYGLTCGEDWPDFTAPVRDLAQRLTPLLLRSLPRSVGVRVCVLSPDPALRVTVWGGVPRLEINVSERMCREYDDRVPSLCRRVVDAVRRRQTHL